MPFQIGSGHGQGFMNDTDGPAFLERKLMGLDLDGRSEFTTMQVDPCPLIRFESITFLLHWSCYT